METAQQHDRFKDAPWYSERAENVLIGGAGGIGSWLALFLARAGFFPTVYDPDVVEAHNIGGQMFRRADIGRHKVDALRHTVDEFCGGPMNTFAERIELGTVSCPFALAAFDNMEARKVFYQNWNGHAGNNLIAPILVDGRLAMEQLQIFCVTPDTMAMYEENYLFDDSMAEDMPCTLRQTTHSAALIAALMTGFFTNHMANVRQREAIRYVPFRHEYFIPANLTEP